MAFGDRIKAFGAAAALIAVSVFQAGAAPPVARNVIPQKGTPVAAKVERAPKIAEPVAQAAFHTSSQRIASQQVAARFNDATRDAIVVSGPNPSAKTLGLVAASATASYGNFLGEGAKFAFISGTNPGALGFPTANNASLAQASMAKTGPGMTAGMHAGPAAPAAV